jgi:hypothetical protein
LEKVRGVILSRPGPSLAWRPFFSRKRNVGLLISIFFGFVAYTALAQIGLAILSRMHLL